MDIREVTDAGEKRHITRLILEALPDWFGMEESREEYIRICADLILQVKTVQTGRYDDYDATNRFYLSLGFKEFEVFPNLWDEANPCQVYVMALR